MIERRKLLTLGAGALATTVATAPATAWSKAFVGPIERHIALHNLHTGEHLSLTYFDKGRYLHGALHQVNHFLRDFRTGQAHAISPQLLDVLHSLSAKLETGQPFQVISGYRSPKTNARLARRTHGVAHHSLHMAGKAIDIRAPGVELADLHKAAKDLGRGGVGYYPDSDFVHVDVGPVRHWGQEPGVVGEG
jgi:uncharacterized protein YcbK (DUF882 family)